MSTHIQNALRRNDAWLPWRYGVWVCARSFFAECTIMRVRAWSSVCVCAVCVCDEKRVCFCALFSVCVRTVIITTEELSVGAGSRSEPEYPVSTRSTPTVSTPRVPPCEYSEYAAAAAPHRCRLVTQFPPKKRKLSNYDDSPMQSRRRCGRG